MKTYYGRIFWMGVVTMYLISVLVEPPTRGLLHLVALAVFGPLTMWAWLKQKQS